MGEVPNEGAQGNISPFLAFVVALALWSPEEARRQRDEFLSDGEPDAVSVSAGFYALGKAWEWSDAYGVPWAGGGIGAPIYAHLRALACLLLVQLATNATVHGGTFSQSAAAALRVAPASYLLESDQFADSFQSRMNALVEGIAVIAPASLTEANPPALLVVDSAKYKRSVLPDPNRQILVRTERLVTDVRVLQARLLEGEAGALAVLERIELAMEGRSKPRDEHRNAWTAIMESLDRIAIASTSAEAEAAFEIQRLSAEHPQWAGRLDPVRFAGTAVEWRKGGSVESPKWRALVELLIDAKLYGENDNPEKEVTKDKLRAHWKYMRKRLAGEVPT